MAQPNEPESRQDDRNAPVIPGRGNAGSGGKRLADKKRRRLWRWIVLLLLLLLILTWSVPHLISTRIGSKMLLSVVNDRTDGQIQIADLSLSWLGPCQASGVTTQDGQGRQTFQSPKIILANGLWQSVVRRGDFAKLTVETPKAVVYLSPEDEAKPKAPGSKGDQPPASSGPMAGIASRLKGQLVIRAGGLRMVQSDGRYYDVAQIDGSFDLNTLNNIKGDIDLDMREKGKVTGQVIVDDLITERRINLGKARGTFHLSTDGDLDVGPLLEFAQSETTAGGKARLKIDASFSAGTVNADISGRLAGLFVGRQGAQTLQPLDLEIEGQIRSQGDQINGQGKLASQAGNINANFTHRRTERPKSPATDAALATILSGKTITLPEFSLAAEGRLDLPVLLTAVPSLLSVRPDLHVTAGQFIIEKVTIEGGSTPSASGAVRLLNLAGQRQGHQVVFDPVLAEFDAKVESGVGLRINRARFDSGFAQVAASGTASKLKGTFKADLNKLHNQMYELFELPTFELAGMVAGKVDLERTDPEKVNVDLELTGQGIAGKINNRQFDLRNLDVSYKGFLSLATDTTAGRVVADAAKVNLDDQIVASGAGSYDLQTHAFQADGQVSKAELAYLARQRAFTGDVDLGRYAGQLSWAGSCRADDSKMSLQGSGQIANLQIGSGSKAVREPQLHLAHDIHLDKRKETIAVKDVKVRSQMFSAQLTGQIKDYNSECILALQGEYDGSWEKITALLHEIAPATKETIWLAGASSGQININGPARQVQVSPVYHGVTGNTSVRWASGDVYGITLGDALLAVNLADGQIDVADTTISAGGGQVHLKGVVVDMVGDVPMLRIPGRVQLCQNVQITAKSGRHLLSRVNPIFANLAGIDGNVSLVLEDVELPLGEQIKRVGTGSGHLDLRQLNVRPSGLLAELMQLGGLSVGRVSDQRMDVKGVNFSVKNGRISYKDFAVNFSDDFALNFYGSVGFDDSLDLFVSVPVGLPLLQRFGVRGSAAEYARLLAGATVDIPVVGTRLEPKLDMARVNLQPLIDRALQDLLREKALEGLGKVLGSQQEPRGDTPQTEGQTPQGQAPPEQRSSEQRVFDIFLDILDEQIEKADNGQKTEPPKRR